MDIEQLASTCRTSVGNEALCKTVLYNRARQVIEAQGLEADSTLRAMEENHILLSGSAALNVVLPGHINIGDLDFFGTSEDTKAFIDYIMSNTDYIDVTAEKELLLKKEYAKDLRSMDYHHARKDSLDVAWLEDKKTGFKINVISTGGDHPITTIQHFDSTLVMNVVSYAGVGCMHPRITCDRLGIWRSHLSRAASSRTDARIMKYRDRGFRVMDMLDYELSVKEGVETDYQLDDITTNTMLWLAYPHLPDHEGTLVVPSCDLRYLPDV